MKPFIFFALAAALHAESICGKRFSTPAVTRAEVVCVDWPALARNGMVVPPGLQAQTQVLIQVPSGRAVEVLLGGQERLAKVLQMRDGTYMALVSFDGIEHEKLPEITVLVEAK